MVLKNSKSERKVVAENIKATGRNIKMDLLILSSLNTEKTVPNLATGEIAKDIWMCKLYKDKLKTVLSSKMDLNQFVESFPKSYERTLPVYSGVTNGSRACKNSIYRFVNPR